MSYIGAHTAFKVRNGMGHMHSSAMGMGSSQTSSGASDSAKSAAASSSGAAGPGKYSEKFMMSVWGLYNKYSVHNIKSHTPFNTGEEN